jgi:hypothetical protein
MPQQQQQGSSHRHSSLDFGRNLLNTSNQNISQPAIIELNDKIGES